MLRPAQASSRSGSAVELNQLAVGTPSCVVRKLPVKPGGSRADQYLLLAAAELHSG